MAKFSTVVALGAVLITRGDAGTVAGLSVIGSPSSEVIRCLAAWSGQVCVGTDQGAIIYDTTGRDSAVNPLEIDLSGMARCLLVHGDRLFIGHDGGVSIVEGQPVHASFKVVDMLKDHGRVFDLAILDGHVVACCDDGVLQLPASPDVAATPLANTDTAIRLCSTVSGDACYCANTNGRVWELSHATNNELIAEDLGVPVPGVTNLRELGLYDSWLVFSSASDSHAPLQLLAAQAPREKITSISETGVVNAVSSDGLWVAASNGLFKLTMHAAEPNAQAVLPTADLPADGLVALAFDGGRLFLATNDSVQYFALANEPWKPRVEVIGAPRILVGNQFAFRVNIVDESDRTSHSSLEPKVVDAAGGEVEYRVQPTKVRGQFDIFVSDIDSGRL